MRILTSVNRFLQIQFSLHPRQQINKAYEENWIGFIDSPSKYRFSVKSFKIKQSNGSIIPNFQKWCVEFEEKHRRFYSNNFQMPVISQNPTIHTIHKLITIKTIHLTIDGLVVYPSYKKHNEIHFAKYTSLYEQVFMTMINIFNSLNNIVYQYISFNEDFLRFILKKCWNILCILCKNY